MRYLNDYACRFDMFLRRLLLCLACLAFSFSAAHAENAPAYHQPDLVSFGFGGFDVLHNAPRRKTFDMRLEYRFGTSLITDAAPSLKSLDETFQIHPFMGIETSPQGQTYGHVGFLFDIMLGKHVVLTPNLAMGVYERGDGKKLGYPLEFRSSMEAGFRFDNGMRLTGYFGHTSNAHLGRKNPGAETAGVYLHVPVTSFYK